MSLIKRVSGRRATSTQVGGGWTDKLVGDDPSDPRAWRKVRKPVPPWSIKVVPPPLSAVLVTPAIAAWFNRVGYYHFNFPSLGDAPQWEGSLKSHGGLYVAAGKRDSCGSGYDQAWETANANEYDRPVDWGCYRITVEPGDYLAVDEDHWDYIQPPYVSEEQCEKLHKWGAGASLDEFAAHTNADSIHHAPRAWGEAFVLRWSGPIIETCVRKNLRGKGNVPNLRVWSAR